MFPFRQKTAATPADAPVVYALVTEDEPILLLNATAMLEDMGFSVVSARTAAEALEVLKQKTVELLITDIHMPGELDGLSLARTAAERWPDIRIVVCSGRSRAIASQLPAGAVFIDKPYTMDDIENAILSL